MTVTAVCSTRSSPGVTSLCVALGAAWARHGVRPLLIEADPAGGVLGLRFALSVDPSLRTLWADMRRGFSPELLDRNTTDLRGVDCLLAPTDPQLAGRALDHVVPILAREVAGLGRPVVIDMGRLSDASQALAFVAGADHVLIVTRPRVEDTQSMLYGARLLEANGKQPLVVAIGDGPHHPDEVASLAGLPLAAVLPDDAKVASAFTGGSYPPRRLSRSTLWRCVDSLASQLVAGSLDFAPQQPQTAPPQSNDVPSWPQPPPPTIGARNQRDDQDITAPRSAGPQAPASRTLPTNGDDDVTVRRDDRVALTDVGAS